MKAKKRVIISFGALITVLPIVTLMWSCQDEAFNASQIRQFTIASAINGANYEIKVGLPSDYSESAAKYETVYVLDGEVDFDFVANNCDVISKTCGVQNVVVVSIGYGRDRSIDYTPTKVSSVTGGGPEFLAFIETQLIPRVEQDFNVGKDRGSRVILGHSYGGLFGACVFAVGNELFGNYIVLSPSIWFDNEVSLQLELDNRDANKDHQQLVFLGIGEAENSGRMQAPFEAFYQALHDNYTNIKLCKNREKNLDHVGSKNPNIVKGLQYYFLNR